MAILIDEGTRLVVQGITGKEGSFHALRNREYGTRAVANSSSTSQLTRNRGP